MPSPGKQRGGGGGKVGSRKGMSKADKAKQTETRPAADTRRSKTSYTGRDKGAYPSRVGYEDRADVRAKPSRTPGGTGKKGYSKDPTGKGEGGPVKTATKAQKQRMQKTKEKQRRKGLAEKATKSKQMISDSSKTPGETKTKRTGFDKTWRSWKTKIASIPGAGGIRGGWGSGKRH